MGCNNELMLYEVSTNVFKLAPVRDFSKYWLMGTSWPIWCSGIAQLQ